jgi:glycosyltransferase involved in cell wall biosynthesis
LKREGLPHQKVETFPWLHTTDYLLNRARINPRRLSDELGYYNALAFDRWTDRRIPPCDAFVAISGAGLRTGLRLQQNGSIFICDRGSTHIRHRAELIEAEHLRWGVLEGAHDDPRDLAREETIYQTADAITVPASHARRTFIERGIAPEKIHVIPYGVLLDRFQKVGDPPANSFEVLYVGRVDLAKGFTYLLEAFDRLRVPNKHLTVVGSVMPEMRSVLARLPQANVTYSGPVPQADLKNWMSRSHVMVMPSLDEGMSLVQGQALACGCPVIATTHSGAEDLFTDGIEGFIVPIRDPAALTARMTRIAEDRPLQQRMSEAAVNHVNALGGWRQYGDTWESLLHRLTGRP